MSTNPQIGKCYKCGSETELWYFDGGFFCKECIRPFLNGQPLHDEFMLSEWINKENKEIGKRSM
jgi:hypothetical protein